MSEPVASCPSDFRLDKHVTWALSASERDAVEAHLAGCPRCRARVDEGRRAVADFAPNAALLEALARPASPGALARVIRLSPRARAIGAAVVCAAAAIVLWVKPADNNIHLKGAPIVRVFAKNAAGTRELDEKSVVHPGETIQFAVTSTGDVWVALFSMDSAQSWSRFVPERDEGLMRLVAGELVPLPRSVILDQVLGDERFVVAVCTTRTLPEVERAARTGGAVDGCTFTVRHLDKRRP